MCHAQEVLSISLNGVTHLVKGREERERGKMAAKECVSGRKTKSNVKLSKHRERREAGKSKGFCLVELLSRTP